MEPTTPPSTGTRLDPWVDAYAARTRGLTASQVRALFAVGFTTVRAHPRHPRLRLDLRQTVPAFMRDDVVEAALDRLLGRGRVGSPGLSREEPLA